MADEQQLNDLATTVEEAVAFPLLTYDTSRARRTGSTTSASGSVSATAQQTVRDALGWRYRNDDPRGFIAALTKACSLREVEGHVEWQWNTQPFMMQAELGELSGALKSVYKQAQNAVEQALPLLESLSALRPDVDTGNAEALRTLVRSELHALVGELGQPAGPRVQRVELFFAQLLGREHEDDAEQVDGYLGRLRDRLGIERRRVNTVEDEQNFTNYLILVDYIVGLRKSFQAKARYFLRGSASEPFLGTQLVLLSQALEVIHEQVQETYDGMDSVFFGAAERQTTVLKLEGQAPITVSELLDWIDTFSAVEGRRLIEDGGKDGIVSFRQNAFVLSQLVGAAARRSATPSSNPTRAFHSKRVAIMLEGLAGQINAAHDLASQVSRRPVNPVENEGKEENVKLDVRTPLAEPVTIVTDTYVVECLPPHRANGHGIEYALDERGRTNQVERNKKYWFVIRGQGLPGALFKLDSDIDVYDKTFHGTTHAVLQIQVKYDAPEGPRVLRYVGHDRHRRQWVNALEVIATRPGSRAIDAKLSKPLCIAAGAEGDLELTGSDVEELIYELDDAVKLVSQKPLDDGKAVVLHVAVRPGATPGWHPLRLIMLEVGELEIDRAVEVKTAENGHRVSSEEADEAGASVQPTAAAVTPAVLAVAARLRLSAHEAAPLALASRPLSALKNQGLELPPALCPLLDKVWLFDDTSQWQGVAADQQAQLYRFQLPKDQKAPLSVLALEKNGKIHYALEIARS